MRMWIGSIISIKNPQRFTNYIRDVMNDLAEQNSKNVMITVLWATFTCVTVLVLYGRG